MWSVTQGIVGAVGSLWYRGCMQQLRSPGAVHRMRVRETVQTWLHPGTHLLKLLPKSIPSIFKTTSPLDNCIRSSLSSDRLIGATDDMTMQGLKLDSAYGDKASEIPKSREPRDNMKSFVAVG